MKKRSTIVADVILIASLVLVSAIGIGIITLTRQEGSAVEVEINGEIVGSYPLSVNGEYPLNGGTNTLVIKDGKAYIKDADCPDKTCEKSGKKSYKGESITCLPNRVTARITGGDDNGVELVS